MPDESTPVRVAASSDLDSELEAQTKLLRTLDAAPERDPADVDAVESGVAEVLAVAEDLGQRHHVGRCHELLWRTAVMRGDRGAAIEHLHAAREAFLAAGAPWLAAIPEARLAELALRGGNGYAAERLARDALRHGADRFPPRQLGRFVELLQQAKNAQVPAGQGPAGQVPAGQGPAGQGPAGQGPAGQDQGGGQPGPAGS